MIKTITPTLNELLDGSWRAHTSLCSNKIILSAIQYTVFYLLYCP